MISINNLLTEIASSLELTETQFANIKTSYEAVAKWLNAGEEIQKTGRVEIFPQGSVGLGTVVKPLRGDEYDVDMVLLINRKGLPASELKRMIGDRLKEHSKYKDMLDKEGKRCWTLIYADSLSYHMDILPTQDDSNPKYYKGNPSILATDKDESTGYYSDKSTNPRGYLFWFFENAQREKGTRHAYSIEKIEEYPRKTTLQKTVQLLKRHRDVYFDSLGIDEDLPLSIIITTLAASNYNGEEDLWKALWSVTNKLESGVIVRGKEYFVFNPTDLAENFAEKWGPDNKKANNFFQWCSKLKYDMECLATSKYPQTSEILTSMFGEQVTKEAYASLSDNAYRLRESGKLKADLKTGTLGVTVGETVRKHTFYGK